MFTNPFRNIFKKEKPKDEIAPQPKKDIIFFQPNTIKNLGSLDAPAQFQVNFKENTQEHNVEFIKQLFARGIILLECDESAKKNLENLSRYFECSNLEVISLSIWLASVLRDAEINNCKLGLIKLDENNIVSEIRPINTV